ncbi:hypothetical protein M758_2G157400 [Ceratodon purpureus]|nr:hypothetical protein M758_2G157400 [Ceratodon purpureus]
MVGAMADMALLHTTSSLPRAALSRGASASAKNFTHFGGFLGSRREVGGEVQKRPGGVRFRLKGCCARASVGEDRRDNAKEPQFPPPGELQYFGKLSAGCVAGAFLVKYGSLCVPSVTTPNINVALLMITTPCVVSVVVLVLASVMGTDGKTKKQ